VAVAPNASTAARLSQRVLVVDDDAVNRLVIQQMLRPSGYPVDSAVDGVEAVSKSLDIRPALILMDISMPRMNGIDAALAIRSRFGGCCPKIVAVTANATDRQRAECEATGFDGFVAKPIDMGELLATVSGILGAGQA